MKVILLENIPGLGRAGDMKTVKDGFGRNYLIAQNLAEMATLSREKYLERKKASLAKKAQLMFESAQELKEKLEKITLTICKKSSVEGKIFGSVTNTDIAALIAEHGFKVDKKRIAIQHVKTVGEHMFHIRLDEGVTADMKIIVENIDQ
ncbi:MAG: 50S ribosomal protein L9 [Brevinemataceae bacterium]